MALAREVSESVEEHVSYMPFFIVVYSSFFVFFSSLVSVVNVMKNGACRRQEPTYPRC